MISYRKFAAGLALASMALLSAWQAAPLSAQTDHAAGRKDNAICMVRPLRNVAQVRPEDRGKPFHILAVEQSVSAFEAKGFSQVQCAEAELMKPEARKAYRDNVCLLAEGGNDAVQSQLERAFGERPSVLCENAELVVGAYRNE